MKRAALVLAMTCAMAYGSALYAQKPAPQPAPAQNGAAPAVPADYVIGPEDVIFVSFWNETGMSAEVTVRPDGKVTLPLLNDVEAAGHTPEQLTALLGRLSVKFFKESPTITVTVKDIRSRRVYILGEVAKPGVYPLNADMNVLQLIATAGGLLEWADKDGIEIVRSESGKEKRHRFNYGDAIRGKNPKQNIALKPGDLIVVP
jgi:polysaccharide export outer membrane protein